MNTKKKLNKNSNKLVYEHIQRCQVNAKCPLADQRAAFEVFARIVCRE